jgi:hypothetical protein
MLRRFMAFFLCCWVVRQHFSLSLFAAAPGLSGPALKSYELQRGEFLSLFLLCVVRTQLVRLPPVDANNVIVCHSFTLLNRTPALR